MEKHAEEELIVVKPDAVGYPGTVMIHLKYASIALRTVMASVWLRFIAPLTDSYATILFLLNWALQSHVRQTVWADTMRLLARSVSAKLYKRAFFSLQVFIVLMYNLLWIFHVAFNHTVWELASKWCCLLIFLPMTKTCLLTSAVWLRLVSAHIPFFVIRDVSWVRPDGANDCDKQVRREECEESGEPQWLHSCRLYFIWVILPYFVERYLWVVTGYRRIEIELNEIIKINDEIDQVFLHMNSRQIDMCRGRKWQKQGLEKPTCIVGSQHAPSSVVPISRSMTVLEIQSCHASGDSRHFSQRNFPRGFLFLLLNWDS